MSRQPRVGHRAVGERGVGGGVHRRDGGGLAGVGRVLSLSGGQRDGQGLLDRPEKKKEIRILRLKPLHYRMTGSCLSHEKAERKS